MSTLKRKIVNLLDRPGGHRFLSAAATHWARSVSGDRDLSVIYDGMWIDVIDKTFIPLVQNDITRKTEKKKDHINQIFIISQYGIP